MRENSASDYPEELLDVFKAAALSVTKLYKSSTAAQSKARIDGYQDCLEDLLALLDKGVPDVRTVRRWALDRLDRESIVPTVESEDEVDKTDATLTPEPQRTDDVPAGAASDTAMRTGSSSPSPSASRAAAVAIAGSDVSGAASSSSSARTRTRDAASPEYLEPVEVTVPMQGAFTYRSSIAYPPESSYLQLANLDLSDKLSSSSDDSAADPQQQQQQQQPQQPQQPQQTHASSSAAASSSSPHSTRTSYRVRHAGSSRFGPRSMAATRHGRSNTATAAGQKRKLNVEEIFDLASLGYGKDVFGRGSSSKRPRQA